MVRKSIYKQVFFFLIISLPLFSLGQRNEPSISEKAVFSPDFSIIDTDSNALNLFSTLATGKTIVLDFFTTSCSSCGFYAPVIDTIYQNHGSGTGNIEFWGIDQSHNDSLVEAFKATYGVTNPCASGLQGNGANVFNLFITEFGLSGTPTYAVICPNKLIFWEVNYPPTTSGFDLYFNACIATNTETIANLTLNKITNLYPNPANSECKIDFLLSENSTGKIEIINSLGQKIIEAEIQSNSKNLDISLNSLTSGMYFVKLLSGNQLLDIKKLNVLK
jgi:thiol-disulfide isomerase/thioredoxin